MATVRKWTNSSLDTLLFCGPKYDFKYLQRIRVPTRPPMVRGSVVHEMVRFTMKRRQSLRLQEELERTARIPVDATVLSALQAIEPGALPVRDEVADLTATAFETRWSKEDVDCREDGGDAVARASTKNAAIDLALHHRDKVAPHYEPIGVELRVTVEPKDSTVELEGTMDLVVAAPGLYRIKDTKTSEKSPSHSMAEDSPQLDMYALLGLKKFKALPDGLDLDYLVRTPTRHDLKYVPLATTRDMTDITALINRINAATRAVEQGVFVPASPNHWLCQSCEYREARAGFQGCPFVRQGERRLTP